MVPGPQPNVSALPASQYILEGFLGEGSMGRVFKARYRGKSVALKFLLHPLDPITTRFFKEELRLLAKLSHPNLVALHDFLDAERAAHLVEAPPQLRAKLPPNSPAIVMEYLEGQTLDRLGADTPMDIWEELFAQCCQGLSYLHRRNILHRDLKPGNLFLTRQGVLKILDFSLSLERGVRAPVFGQGTLPFMAPEAFAGILDFRSDLFSLGSLFYLLLSGRLPYPKPLTRANLPKTLPAQALQDLKPELPEYLTTLIDHLLRLDPNRRPSSPMIVSRYLDQHRSESTQRNSEASSLFVPEKGPWVGREYELMTLDPQVQVTAKSSLILLSGPAGVGRTRFLEEFKWRQILKGHAFIELQPDSAETWRRTLTDRLGIPQAGETPSDLPSFVETLASHSPTQATVVALADIHLWPETVRREVFALLRLIQGSLRAYTWILEFSEDSDFKMPNFSEALQMRLTDLTDSETLLLLKQILPEDALDEPTRKLILQASGGRPFLVMEALRQVVANAELSAQDLRQLHLPRSFNEAVQLRLGGLSQNALLILALMVVEENHLSLETVGQLLHEPIEAIEAAVLELDRIQILSPRLPQQPHLTLSHPAMQESLRESLPSDLLRRAHQSYLDFFCETRAQQPSDPHLILGIIKHALLLQNKKIVAELGLEALALLDARGENLRALQWIQKIIELNPPNMDWIKLFARQAPLFFREGKFAEALEAYRRWYEIRPDDESRLQKVKFHYFCGATLFAWGRKSEAAQELQTLLATSDVQRYRALHPYYARAYLILALVAESSGDIRLSRQHLKSALDLQPEDPALVGEIELRAGEFEARALNFDHAALHLTRARDGYAKSERRGLEALALNALAILKKDRGQLQSAILDADQAMALAREAGEALPAARFEGNRGLILLELGLLAQGLKSIQSSFRVLQALGSEEEVNIARMQLLSAWAALGNFVRFGQVFQELRKDKAALDRLGLWNSLLLLKAELALRCGEATTVQALIQPLLQNGETPLRLRVDAALLYLRLQIRQAHPILGAMEPWLGYLEQLSSPLYQAWGKLLRILSKGPPSEAQKKFEDLVRAPPVEPVDWRLEALGLMAAKMRREGFQREAKHFETQQYELWKKIHHSLPEEYRMDHEKTRGRYELESALDAPLAPTTPPPVADFSTPLVSQATPISEEKFRQYCEVTLQISQKTDLNEILERVMEAALLLTGAERGLLILKNEKAVDPFKGFEIKAVRHFNQDKLSNADLQLSRSLIEQAIAEGAPILADNAQQDERFQEMKSVHLYQLKSILVVPIGVGGKIIGVLYLDHRYRPDCFGNEDLTILSGFASQAALAIERSSMLSILKLSKSELENQVQDQAQRIQILSDELSQSRDSLKYEYPEIIGGSPAMVEVLKLLDHVTKTKIPVWIWGESGTGKELVARALHFNSPRKTGPYVTENCSSIPETLLESEMFGHKKGSFTHADRDRVGLFEQANGGTLFLDEVADMPLAMQAKMLRVLQEGEIRPVGSSKKVPIDIRLVTASNRDLAAMVEKGKFREDLFYRINGMTLHLPPLRERKEDIPLLVHFLVKKIAKDFELKPSKFLPGALEALVDHDWPGNVRELEGMVRNLLLFSDGGVIDREFIEAHRKRFKKPSLGTKASKTSSDATSPPDEKSMEFDQLIEALKKHHMDKNAVAKELNLSVKSVYMRMKKFGVPKKNSLLMNYLEKI